MGQRMYYPANGDTAEMAAIVGAAGQMRSRVMGEEKGERKYESERQRE